MSNKTSDKNVVNVEEDVRLIKRYLEDSSYKESDSDFFKNGGWEIIDLEIPRAMENILAELEQKDKRIQEIEAKLEFKKFGDLDNVEFEEYMSQFIPKQVVIDKIEELNEEFNKINTPENDEWYIDSDQYAFAEDILQELLEGEK